MAKKKSPSRSKARKKKPPRARDIEEHFHSDDPRQAELPEGFVSDSAATDFAMLAELAKAGDVSILKKAAGWMVDRTVVAGTLCQLQYVRCGKKCWCMRRSSPPFHGPYWYAYTFNKRGKLRSIYVGLELNADLLADAIG